MAGIQSFCTQSSSARSTPLVTPLALTPGATEAPKSPTGEPAPSLPAPRIDDNNAALLETVRLETARLETARPETARLETACLETARLETARLETARSSSHENELLSGQSLLSVSNSAVAEPSSGSVGGLNNTPSAIPSLSNDQILQSSDDGNDGAAGERVVPSPPYPQDPGGDDGTAYGAAGERVVSSPPYPQDPGGEGETARSSDVASAGQTVAQGRTVPEGEDAGSSSVIVRPQHVATGEVGRGSPRIARDVQSRINAAGARHLLLPRRELVREHRTSQSHNPSPATPPTRTYLQLKESMARLEKFPLLTTIGTLASLGLGCVTDQDSALIECVSCKARFHPFGKNVEQIKILHCSLKPDCPKALEALAWSKQSSSDLH